MSIVSEHHLADVMVEIARRLNQSSLTIQEQLNLVLEDAHETVSGIDAASITVIHRDGRIETVAGTDELVYRLDQMQYDFDEGPCLDALRGAPVQRVDDMPAEDRWPQFAPKAADAGVRSHMAMELYADERSIGGLNLYSRSSHAFDEDTRHLAWLFASHAAMAMGHTRRHEDMSQALATRKVIGQAIGAVMQRFELDEARAFEFLVRVSNSGNIKLRDVAQQVVDELNAQAHAKD